MCFLGQAAKSNWNTVPLFLWGFQVMVEYERKEGCNPFPRIQLLFCKSFLSNLRGVSV